MFENDGQDTRIKELAEDVVLTEAHIKHLEQRVIAKKFELKYLMQQAGQTAVKLTSGLAPRIETKQRISKRKGVADDDLFSWLDNNDLADIIKWSVNPRTLQSALEGFTAGGKEVPDDLFNCFEQTVLRFTGKTSFLEKNGSELKRRLKNA